MPNRSATFQVPNELVQQLANLIQKSEDLSEQLSSAQSLLGSLYANTEKKIRNIAADYSFLSSDHIFFDGDHENHSGAV